MKQFPIRLLLLLVVVTGGKFNCAKFYADSIPYSRAGGDQGGALARRENGQDRE